jgi:MYXO-CTERM domain-containing protein
VGGDGAGGAGGAGGDPGELGQFIVVDDGCGCRLARSRSSTWSLALLALLGLVRWRRRRG